MVNVAAGVPIAIVWWGVNVVILAELPARELHRPCLPALNCIPPEYPVNVAELAMFSFLVSLACKALADGFA